LVSQFMIMFTIAPHPGDDLAHPIVGEKTTAAWSRFSHPNLDRRLLIGKGLAASILPIRRLRCLCHFPLASLIIARLAVGPAGGYSYRPPGWLSWRSRQHHGFFKGERPTRAEQVPWSS
jgi:hypothetical protein